MPKRPVNLSAPADAELRARFVAIRAGLGFPETFSTAVLAEADESARHPALPERDLTAIPFVTLDPPTSMDLDQAFHLERWGEGGYRVRYAIADVAAFVRPGDQVDAECHRRVETGYCPDRRVPLHPAVLSEQAASLLPDGARPAHVWTVDVDAAGVTNAIGLERAMVASRAKLSYPEVQATLDAGQADEMLALLPEVGEVLLEAERARGGMSLNVPSQEVVARRDGYHLEYVASLPVEDWNAQLSLLTGRAAATLMLDAGVGVLRTMPPAHEGDVARLRRVAAGLGVDWPDERSYEELLQGLDGRRSPAEAAFLEEAAVLFRGAGYTSFQGERPSLTTHSAIAAPYAHCTAPLRRLVDRYSLEVCSATAAGRPVPA